MNIYVAAPWIHREQAKIVAEQLEAAGHTITHPWWEFDDESGVDLKQRAEDDRWGVEGADLLVLLNTAKSEGKAVEQGMAIELGLNIYAIGKNTETKNVFHHLDNYIWCDDVEDVIERLK